MSYLASLRQGKREARLGVRLATPGGNIARTGHSAAAGLSDEDARALLTLVGLGELCPARYSLDQPEEWETILSGGERQRLAWAQIVHGRLGPGEVAPVPGGRHALLSRDLLRLVGVGRSSLCPRYYAPS